MKKLLLIILFFVSWTAAKAQDKIITIKQDTIECRIVSINAERISYEQKTSDNHFAGKSIPTSEVLHYSRTGKPDRLDGLDLEKAQRERPEHRWLFSLQGGLAHSFTDYSDFKNILLNQGNSASATNDYFSKLENGYHFNASLHYLLSSFVGLGIDYNLFYSASKGEFMYKGYGGINVPVYMKLRLDEKVYTQFAGASFLFQQFPDKKKKIRISQILSPGMVLIRNESRDNQYQPYGGYGYGYPYSGPSYYDQANSLTTGIAFGAKGSLAIDYALTPQLSAGLAGNFMWAELQKVSTKNSVSETKDQELEKSINLSHIDYGFTVRYNF